MWKIDKEVGKSGQLEINEFGSLKYIQKLFPTVCYIYDIRIISGITQWKFRFENLCCEGTCGWKQ